MKHAISVEDDDILKGKKMVVIRDDKGEVVGIPLRGATPLRAAESRDSLRCAFIYGVAAATRSFQGWLYKVGSGLRCENK